MAVNARQTIHPLKDTVVYDVNVSGTWRIKVACWIIIRLSNWAKLVVTVKDPR